MAALPSEIVDKVVQHAASICSYYELLQLRCVNYAFQRSLEKLIFDHLHEPIVEKSGPYLDGEVPTKAWSRVRAYEFDLHHEMLARMIFNHSQHWKERKSSLASCLQKVAQANKIFRVEHDLSTRTDDEKDLLAIAIRSNGAESVLSMLHSERENIIQQREEDARYGILALMAHQNDLKGVRILIGTTMNQSSYCAYLGTAAHIAARNGHLEILELLYRNGADINEPSGTWRQNCLQAAALNGHTEVVKFLLTTDLRLDLARNARCQPELLKYFQRRSVGGASYSQPNDLEAAVICAILSSDHASVGMLLSEIVARDLQPCGHVILSVFTTALEMGGKACVQVVLDGLKQPSGWDVLGIALRIAVRANNQEQARQILGSSAFQQPTLGWTRIALVAAAERGSTDFVKLIIAHGDNISPWWSVHSLCAAIRKGRHDVIEILLSNGVGVDLDAQAHLSQQRRPDGYWPSARMRNVIENQPLAAAASSKHPDLIPRLIDHGISLTGNDAGIWALNVAAWKGKEVAARILVEAGVDPSSPMPLDTAFNPMILAVANERTSMVRFLEGLGQELPPIDAAAVRFRFTRRPHPREHEQVRNND